jgi:hypothetical protein
MEEKMLKIGFSYSDELGQETKLEKSFTLDTLECLGSFELLVNEFKYFLLAKGFSRETVDCIQIVE